MAKSTKIIAERNNSLDVLKILLAILVVLRHVPSVYQTILMPITTCGVPVFFMISGYLVFCKDVDYCRLLKSAKRIALILLYAAVFYYFFYYITHGYWYIPTFQDIVVFSLINDIPFAGHLWYLAAYVYVLLFIAILYRIGKSNILKYLVPILVGIYIAADIVYYCAGFDHSLTLVFLFRSWLFTGLPFFCTGALLQKRQNILSKKSLSFVLLVSFSLLALFETVIFLPDNHISDVFYTTWPLCFSLFSFFAVTQIRKNNLFARLGQKYSLYIYLFHPAVIPFIKNYIGDNVWGDWFQPFIVLVLSFIFSVLYVKVKTYVNNLISNKV